MSPYFCLGENPQTAQHERGVLQVPVREQRFKTTTVMTVRHTFRKKQKHMREDERYFWLNEVIPVCGKKPAAHTRCPEPGPGCELRVLRILEHVTAKCAG